MPATRRKLDREKYRTAMQSHCDRIGVEAFRTVVSNAQTALYVMTGGGWIGRQYAEQPADAYTDARVGRLPYKGWEIENARMALVIMAEVAGLDPHNMPPMPQLYSMGVW